MKMVHTRKAKPAIEIVSATDQPEIVSYKGFDLNLTCRGMQYEIGQTYTHDGDVVVCSSGLHACEHPLNVLKYYPPSGSRYAEVRQSGQVDRDRTDTKIASARLTVTVELSLHEMTTRAVQWVFSRAKPENREHATGRQGAASATGSQGRVMGIDGNALFLVYRDPDTGEIIHAWAGIVGHDGVQAGVWYSLGSDGLPATVEECQ